MNYDLTFKKAFNYLEHDESILSNINCSIDIHDDKKYINGTLIVTNKRIFFYSSNKEHIHNTFQEYRYENMTNIKKHEKESELILFFGYNKKIIELKNIISNNLNRFISIINKKVMNSKMVFYSL